MIIAHLFIVVGPKWNENDFGLMACLSAIKPMVDGNAQNSCHIPDSIHFVFVWVLVVHFGHENDYIVSNQLDAHDDDPGTCFAHFFFFDWMMISTPLQMMTMIDKGDGTIRHVIDGYDKVS